MLNESSPGQFLFLCKGSAINGLSVKSAGLRARGPAPLRPVQLTQHRQLLHINHSKW